MKLIKIIANNYKGYSSLELNLNTLNVLIGKNGSGKSTVTRLIPLIISSLNHSDLGPLNLNIPGIDIGGRFSDLSKNQRESSTITLGASFKMSSYVVSFTTSLIHDNELKKIIVKSFLLEIDNEVEIDVELCLEESTDIDPNLFYDNLTSSKIILSFSGLLPSIVGDFIENKIKQNDILKGFFVQTTIIPNRVSYLGPFRAPLKRVYQYNQGILNIGPQGESAPYIFCNDKNEKTGILQQELKEWMVENFEGKYITVKQYEFGFSLNVNKNSLENNIVDDGVGFSQFFPLLINRLSRRGADNNSIEIVEQPELHLHPAACGTIADLYLTSLENNNNTILLETHSKEILLRLRRRIAESKDSDIHNGVNIIYTSNTQDTCEIDYITVNKSGELDWWPEGVFEESFEEVVAISEANHAD
ncbi:MAG: AAA family ATPase [Olleya sp.]